MLFKHELSLVLPLGLAHPSRKRLVQGRRAELYNEFYLNKKKVIPNNIYELLTPVSLAFMIMGDGLNDHSRTRGLVY